MKNKKTRRIISIILFVIYFCVLFYFLFFAESMGRNAGTKTYCYNLIPFKEINRFLKYRETLGNQVVMLNLIGNIAAFIPFGLFIIPVSGRRISFVSAVRYSFYSSLLVEFIQLVTKVGSFDVDDMILNTLGGLIGAGVYLIWKLIERKFDNGRKKIQIHQ